MRISIRSRSVASHPNGNIDLTNTGNPTIRVVSPAGMFSTFAEKGGKHQDGTGYTDSQDGTGSAARFDGPHGVAVADSRKVTTSIDRISSIEVAITLIGGWNGDLYAYPSHAGGWEPRTLR